MAINLTAVANATVGTMRAVLWQGNAYNVTVANVPRPNIINQTDANLHIYRGTNQGPATPWILGHEGIGYIESIGDGVGSLAIVDPVIIPFNVAEGHAYTDLTTSMYGGYGTGQQGGTQSEYLRPPFADDGLIPIPTMLYTDPATNETRSLMNDYVMLSDNFATGWAALDFAGFKAGDTIAIFGAGPVGLMAMYAAQIRGVSRVYVVDYVDERLALVRSHGGIPVNFRNADPVQKIMALEPNGVARSIDAVGYKQVNRNLTVEADVIITNMLAVTSTGGGLGTVGVYNPGGATSIAAPGGSAVQDTVKFSMADFFTSEFKWEAVPSKPIALAPELVALVSSGRVRHGFTAADEINIEDAPDAYRRFERHETVKVVIAFD